MTLTPEKMEILSLPGPDRSITDEDMKRYHFVARQNRNRRIGDFLRELDLVEGRNTGIPDILRAMELNGSAKPIFETNKEREYFLVTLPVHEFFLPQETKGMNQQNVDKKPSRRKSFAEVKTLVFKCLKSKGELSMSELATQMGYARLTATISRAVKELVSEGKVRMSHPENPHSQNQKLSII